MGRNLTNLPISASFQYLLQVSGSEVNDGLGNDVDLLTVTASHASNADFATSASFATFASGAADTNAIYTASYSNPNLTFEKGDGSSFDVVISTTVDTGSLMETGSVSDATLTFTKADASTFDLTVDNVANATSASYAATASFASNVSTPTLQQVTDAGATTTTDVRVVKINIGGIATEGDINVSSAGNAEIFKASSSFGVVIGSVAQDYNLTHYGNTIQDGNVNVTGSVTASAGFKGDLEGNADTATTASYVETAQTASYVAGANVDGDVATATSASHAITADTASFLPADTNLNISTISASFGVFQSASIGYLQQITGSAKIIGDAYIILNNDTPTERYAGIIVQDSGSTQNTASFEFDGQTNDWFYEYTDDGGATAEFGVVMFGPGYNTRGAHVYPSNNTILKGTGDHHIVDSIITDDGSEVVVAGDLTGNVVTANTYFVGDLIGTASFASSGTGAFSGSFTGDGSGLTGVGGGELQYSGSTYFATTGSGAVNYDRGVVIGHDAQINGSRATAIGEDAQSDGESTALGWNTTAENRNIAVGFGASANTNERSVSLGWYSEAVGEGSIAIGEQPDAEGSYNIAIGHFAKTLTTNNIAIGRNAEAYDQNDAIAIGAYASASGQDAVAIGVSTTASNADTIAIGDRTSAIGVGDIAMGQLSTATSNYGVAIGFAAESTSEDAVAIGRIADASGTDSVAIGYNARAQGSDDIAVGDNARATSGAAVAIGQNTEATTFCGVAIGASARAQGTNAISIGRSCQSSAQDSIGIGQRANRASGATGGAALGSFTDVDNAYGTAIGYGAQATGSLAMEFRVNQLPLISATTASQDVTFYGGAHFTDKVTGDVGSLSIASTTASMDCSAGNFFTLTLANGVDTHLDATNITAGQTINLKVTNNATGAGTISFAPEFEFVDGTAFEVTATTSAVDIMTFVSFDGTSLQATGLKNFS